MWVTVRMLLILLILTVSTSISMMHSFESEMGNRLFRLGNQLPNRLPNRIILLDYNYILIFFRNRTIDYDYLRKKRIPGLI